MKAGESVLIKVPLPSNGLDEEASFYSQPRNTSPLVLNCMPSDPVTGRKRLSRRGGLSKYVPNQVVAGSVQEITSIVVPLDQAEGTGDLFTIGGNALDNQVRIYTRALGAVESGGNYQSLTLNSAKSMGCTDADGAYYVAAISSGVVQVAKIGTDFTVLWNIGMVVSGSGSIFGLTVFEDIVYVWAVDIGTPGIYRFNADNGARLDSGVWNVSGLATVTGITTCHQCLSSGAGLVGVVGGKSGKLILQQIRTSDAVVVHETDLQSTFESYPAKVTQDRGGNFYVLTNTKGAAANHLFKVLLSGAIQFDKSYYGVGTTTGTGARDLCYEPVGYRLGICGVGSGTGMFGRPESLIIVDAVTGGYLTSVSPNITSTPPVTSWEAIAPDGIEASTNNPNGGFRLRRTSATEDIHSTAPLWTVTSSSGAVSETLWAVCSNRNVAPTPATMQSTRQTTNLIVVGGQLHSFTSDGSEALSTTFCSGSAPVVFSSRRGNNIVFLDGASYRTYNGTTGVVGTLLASVGTLPGSASGAKCRLVESWRDRIVMAGLISVNDDDTQSDDSHILFGSAQGDMTNWDYSPDVQTEQQAFSGSQQTFGPCPDIINGIAPFSNEKLIILGDHSIQVLTGDPMAGGRWDEISRITGGAWGRAYCFDPTGSMYFFGRRGALWKLSQGSVPVRVSSAIDSTRLFDIDQDAHIVRLAWDDRNRGVIILISPKNKNTAATHYFWSAETERTTTYQVVRNPGSWWPWSFTNKNHNGLALYILDGDAPDDRHILIGTRDGYVLKVDDDAIDDDGTAISSQVLLGPIVSKDGLAFNLTDLQCTLGMDSADVSYKIRFAECLEAAYRATGKFGGTWTAGRNRSIAIRTSQHAAYVELLSSAKTQAWSVEDLAAVIQMLPPGVAQRSF